MSDPGSTHFYGDGCDPPHPEPVRLRHETTPGFTPTGEYLAAQWFCGDDVCACSGLEIRERTLNRLGVSIWPQVYLAAFHSDGEPQTDEEWLEFFEVCRALGVQQFSEHVREQEALLRNG